MEIVRRWRVAQSLELCVEIYTAPGKDTTNLSLDRVRIQSGNAIKIEGP